MATKKAKNTSKNNQTRAAKALEKTYKVLGWAIEPFEDISPSTLKLYLQKLTTVNKNKIDTINFNNILLNTPLYNPLTAIILSKHTIDSLEDLFLQVKTQSQDLQKIIFENAPKELTTELHRYVVSICSLIEYSSNLRWSQAKAVWKKTNLYTESLSEEDRTTLINLKDWELQNKEKLYQQSLNTNKEYQ